MSYTAAATRKKNQQIKDLFDRAVKAEQSNEKLKEILRQEIKLHGSCKPTEYYPPMACIKRIADSLTRI